MPDTNRFKHHADLMDRMATSMGIDLEERVLRGQITPDQLVDAALACTGCSNPQACARHLDTLQGLQAETPQYCRNSDLFRDLQER